MAASDTVRSTFELHSSVLTKEFCAGVELEIEDFQNFPDTHWNRTEDGSLRNNGYEYISPPENRAELVEGFKRIHKTAHLGPKPFSERTSIHVHVNCLDLTQEQVKSVVLWYALFEPIFFQLVDPIRRNNIHCIGLDQTCLSEQYRRTLPMFVSKWSKYTALNLLPLGAQGTIEFRHMHGHADAQLFGQWLATLENLWTYGKDNKMTKDLLTEDNILKAYACIFAATPLLSVSPAIILATVADTALDVKLALV